jgi:hypothetical protein
MRMKPLNWDSMVGWLHAYGMKRLISLAYMMVLHTND